MAGLLAKQSGMRAQDMRFTAIAAAGHNANDVSITGVTNAFSVKEAYGAPFDVTGAINKGAIGPVIGTTTATQADVALFAADLAAFRAEAHRCAHGGERGESENHWPIARRPEGLPPRQ